MTPIRTKPPDGRLDAAPGERPPYAPSHPGGPASPGTPQGPPSLSDLPLKKRRIRPAEACSASAETAVAAARRVRFDLPPALDATRQLQRLGYTDLQIQGMNPEAREAVATHHASLAAKGFDQPMLSGIARWHRTLPWLLRHFDELLRRLPGLGPAELSVLAQSREGSMTLETLLEVTDMLKAPPLRLVDRQLFDVAREGAFAGLRALHMLGASLLSSPLGLTPNDLVAIACRGGGKALFAVYQLAPYLHEARLDPVRIVQAAASPRAKAALEAALHPLLALRDGHLSLSSTAWLPAEPSIQDLCDPLVEPGGLFDSLSASGRRDSTSRGGD